MAVAVLIFSEGFGYILALIHSKQFIELNLESEVNSFFCYFSSIHLQHLDISIVGTYLVKFLCNAWLAETKIVGKLGKTYTVLDLYSLAGQKHYWIKLVSYLGICTACAGELWIMTAAVQSQTINDQFK